MKDLRDLKDLTIHDVQPISDEYEEVTPVNCSCRHVRGLATSQSISSLHSGGSGLFSASKLTDVYGGPSMST